MTTLPDIDQEAIRKEYENMSYNEMSKRLAESYKQLSEMLGNTMISDSLSNSSSTATLDTHNNDDDEQRDEDNDDDDEQKKSARISKLFLKSVSSGNVEKVKEFLENPLIDIDAKDEDGTTALIYAACFGKFEIAQLLVLKGANMNNQDSHGWTALMWATTNNHEKIVKLLLEHGASSQTRSAKGRTVFDFVQKSETSNKIADILATNPRDSVSSTSSMMGYSTSTSSMADNERYYQLHDDNFESFLSIDKPKLIEEFLMNFNDDNDDDDFDNMNDDYGDEDEEEQGDKEVEFNWERCMPDQMFVFAADDLPYILDTVITKLTLPIRNVQDIFMPANVVFLSARFAHYFSSAELAEDVMEGALLRINTVIKSNTQNVHILSYWMTNITRLVYYLKKDAELVVVTAEYQLRLSELISETYNFIVNDIGKRVTQLIVPAMLEYDPISGMEEVNFSDDWQRFFRRSTSSRRSEDNNNNSSNNNGSHQMQRNHSSNMSNEPSAMAKVISPKSITQLFSSTYYVFQSYEVHSTIVIQALAQFFHSLSCELFNRILSNKKYLCRSKAVQVRMNLSALEEWIHHNNLPTSMVSYLKPSIQLTQLLQCLSQLDTVSSFESTIKMFDAINPIQIRRCVVNYRYETQEPRIPEEIEQCVNKSVEETMKIKQARQSMTMEKRKSFPVSQQLRRSLSGCSTESMSQIMGTIFNSHTEHHAEESKQAIKEEEEEEGDDDKGDTNETKDARFLLPFFVPTIAQLSHTGSRLTPIIPEDWMNKLDKSS